jgi:hypothetical protein
MRRWLLLGLLFALPVAAEERVSVCYNYGCYAQAVVVYSEAQMQTIAALLANAQSAAEERSALGPVIGRLLGWAGEQSPIKADRGGNYADAGVPGMMDCIDHSTTTTRLLRVLEARGLLRYHRVLEPALRRTLFVFLHYSAQIEELAANKDAEPNASARFVVDSWFFDNGEPAVVMPLANWMAGEGPDDID